MRSPLQLAWMSMRERNEQRAPSAGGSRDSAVLFLPGFASSPRTLACPERSVRRLGRSTLRVALRSARRDIRDYACEVYDLVETLVDGPQRIDLVDHSMGGPVAAFLRLLARLPLPEECQLSSVAETPRPTRHDGVTQGRIGLAPPPAEDGKGGERGGEGQDSAGVHPH